MTNVLPSIFKAIALFTPGGDLIYGIDSNKQVQWHHDLCLGMQRIWNLDDSPDFLVPGYTATVERWLDPQTQQVQVIAEVNPPVEQYIPLLQVLFNLDEVKWNIAPWQEEYCNRAVIETYKPHFPQLWEQKDLIIRLDPDRQPQIIQGRISNSLASDISSGYVLQLFISSNNSNAEKTLSNIHQILEQGLDSPYTLKVIDISKNPQQGKIHKIAITPTLVRLSPKPIRRIEGGLDDIQRILRIITSF